MTEIPEDLISYVAERTARRIVTALGDKLTADDATVIAGIVRAETDDPPANPAATSSNWQDDGLREKARDEVARHFGGCSPSELDQDVAFTIDLVVHNVAQPELDRLRDEHQACHNGRDNARQVAARLERELLDTSERAERAEAANERVRHLADEALHAWKPEREYHQERADRKGYAHDELAAAAYGRAIEALTEILAALDQQEGDRG